MAISMEYFPYARHQSDLHAISHFIIMSNHVVGISIFVSWIRKPMGIESLKIFAYGNTTNKLQNQDSNSRYESKAHVINDVTNQTDVLV